MLEAPRRDIGSEIEAALDRAMRQSQCQGIVVARLDGLPIGFRFLADLNPRVLSAVAGTVFGAAEVVARELKTGHIEQIALQYSDCRVVGVGAGKDAVLLGLYLKDSNLGLTLIALSRAASEVASLLEGL